MEKRGLESQGDKPAKRSGASWAPGDAGEALFSSQLDQTVSAQVAPAVQSSSSTVRPADPSGVVPWTPNQEAVSVAQLLRLGENQAQIAQTHLLIQQQGCMLQTMMEKEQEREVAKSAEISQVVAQVVGAQTASAEPMQVDSGSSKKKAKKLGA